MDWLLGGAGSHMQSISVRDAWERLSSKQHQDAPILIDVREPWEFGRGHARGARNIPLGAVMQRLQEIPQDRDVLVICQSGHRSGSAVKVLLRAGYTRVFNVSGGTSAWQMHQLPLA